MRVDIKKLLLLEAELKNPGENATSSVDQDAMVNMLKHLQIQTVLQFQEAYDALYYKLNKDGGLECVHSIAAVRSKDVLQPKILELQDCDEESRFEKVLQFYLAEAELAKQRLDKLVKTAVEKDSEKYEVQCAEVKSRASTERKVNSSCGGDVRRVTDMARVTVICDTPEALKEVYLAIVELLQGNVLRVKNGFNSDWMPSGYRDVKVNPAVNDHLCEIQLHLREFYALKRGQHAVYEWARDLNVTTEMRPSDLFKNVSREVTEKMVRLAWQNWHGTWYCLSDLQLAAGQYAQAETGVRQAKYAEAEPLYAQIQEVKEKYMGAEHPRLARTLNNWAGFLKSQARYAAAEPLYLRSQSIREKALGTEHPEVAVVLNNRACLMESQGNYKEAGRLYERSLAIREKALGPDHPAFATTLTNQAGLLRNQGKYAEAELRYVRAQTIREKVLGPDHPNVAQSLNHRGGLLEIQGKFSEAEPLYERSQATRESLLGPEHPDVAAVLNNRGWLSYTLVRVGKFAEAEFLYNRAIEIGEKSMGPGHPELACWLDNQGALLTAQGKYDEAEPRYVRAQTIREVLGQDHPDVANSLDHRAGFLEIQGKFAEAESLYERSHAIRENLLGLEHPDVARVLNNRGRLCYTL
ncbi:unnamed protein product, partial [Ectocarpus sp. 8 AP-2014]